ncbi:unnamed protein product [Cyprideis torosa]|uniref:DUS-like FMN-binding domain-containing protein n=1 Tax=Cyprideis torosa TaxID=163714 RepID=A0A7R8ZVI7_9CRUS|nr:unnamed protein product [Cyprideis torosa]CAG0902834.1 unnamed protein product [Cyprideis torosa]
MVAVTEVVHGTYGELRDSTENPVLWILRDPSTCAQICAPMVRYSKLAFRRLVREFGCHIAYTPMIIADSFVQSEKAREVEFSTSPDDRPLVVQFAASDPVVFGQAASLVSRQADGVGLNCGCPQRWAMEKGLGASLLKDPEKIREMVRSVRNAGVEDSFSVSVKIRLLQTPEKSLDLCRQIEAAGAAYVCVHGRKTHERPADAVNYEAIRLIKDALQIPLVANGDIKTMEDVRRIQEMTSVNGVMVARGLLKNPALFQGSVTTPLECVRRWTELAEEHDVPFCTMHHHLMFMVARSLPKAQRKIFNALPSTEQVLEFLQKTSGCSTMPVSEEAVDDLPDEAETARELPALVGLLSEINKELEPVLETLKQKRELIRLRQDEALQDEEGISLLALKNEIFAQYLLDLALVIQRKVEGQSLQGDEEEDDVVWRLVEGRVYLERIRPIERLLKYPIDKLIKAATDEDGTVGPSDPLSYRSNLASLMSAASLSEDEEDEDEEEDDLLQAPKKEKGKGGVYVPPKMSAVFYDDDEKESREKRRLELVKKKMLSSDIMRDLRSEFMDSPEEVFETATVVRRRKLEAQKEKEAYEEERMVRLPQSRKADRSGSNARLSTIGSLGKELTKMGAFRDALTEDGDFLTSLPGGEKTGTKKKKKKSSGKTGKKRKMKFKIKSHRAKKPRRTL